MAHRPHFVLAACLAMAGACGVPNSEAAGPSGPPPAARVEVASVGPGQLDDRWVFLGEVRPFLQAELAAGAAGEVRTVTVRVGDHVDAGQVLLSVDNRLAQARVKAAKASRSETAAELAQAQRDRVRSQQLGATILPQAEVERDDARAQSLAARRASLQASLRQAKVSLGRHKVLAPFAGTIATRRVDPGDWVGEGDSVLELVADGEIEIIVQATPDLVRYVKPGDSATLRSDEFTAAAEIRGVVRALDPQTRTAKIRLVPSEPAGWLLPGSTTDVEFTVKRQGKGVVVPRDALVRGPVDVRVVRVSGDQAESIRVEVIATAANSALIEAEGLEVGDQVVVRGNERLRPGQPIVIVEPGRE